MDDQTIMEMPAYVPPRLTIYGSVALLTAAGSGRSCEVGKPVNNAGHCRGKTGNDRTRRQ